MYGSGSPVRTEFDECCQGCYAILITATAPESRRRCLGLLLICEKYRKELGDYVFFVLNL